MSGKIDFPTFLTQIGVLSESKRDSLFSEDQLKSDIGFQMSLLREKSGIDSMTLDYYLSEWRQMPMTFLDTIDESCIKELPEKISRRFNVIAFAKHEGNLHLAASNPYDENMLSMLNQSLEKSHDLFMAPAKLIETIVNRHFRQTENIERLAVTAKGIATENSAVRSIADGIDRVDSKASLVNLLDHILQDALQCEATDIHIEANFDHLIYYYRVGHESSEVVSLPLEISDMLVQRLIILGDGDIAQKKLPQDLSFSFKRQGSGDLVNVRLSVLFTQTGYSVVMRLLLSQGKIQDLEKILLDKETFEEVSDFLLSEHGMMLVTGPTASGKTTLLYSLLKRVHNGHKKIISIEDPIEIQFSHLNQVQVNPDVGLDFSDVIRSSLRQNPDVLMVGEIRDKVTANMAMRAAITGVLVFSTLHTSNTIKTVTRLVDLGVDPFLIGSALRLVLATRLLKRICSSCKKISRDATDEEKRLLGGEYSKVVEGSGCSACHNTGTQGLILIAEKLFLSEKLQDLIVRKKYNAFEQEANELLNGRRLVDQAKKLFDEEMIPVDQLIKLVCDV